MKMSYVDALLSPDISWETLIEAVTIPEKLYKYQFFYSKDRKENKYWKNNMQGEFHLSLGREFEDINDCRPYINKKDVEQYLVDFFKLMDAENVNSISAIKQFNERFDENNIARIVQNYQSKIRIGCFTDSFENRKMWEKYSNNSTGFCIEYDIKKSELFSSSVLPVLYTTKQYNMSKNYACSFILELCQQAKKRSEQEQLRIYQDNFRKMIKTAYIPVFLKDRDKWLFEREYRMFILKRRKTQNGWLRMEKILDKNYNIDLSKAIKAIYLGENFHKNENADELYNDILNICNDQGNLFEIYKIDSYGIAQRQY